MSAKDGLSCPHCGKGVTLTPREEKKETMDEHDEEGAQPPPKPKASKAALAVLNKKY